MFPDRSRTASPSNRGHVDQPRKARNHQDPPAPHNVNNTAGDRGTRRSRSRTSSFCSPQRPFEDEITSGLAGQGVLGYPKGTSSHPTQTQTPGLQRQYESCTRGRSAVTPNNSSGSDTDLTYLRSSRPSSTLLSASATRSRSRTETYSRQSTLRREWSGSDRFYSNADGSR